MPPILLLYTTGIDQIGNTKVHPFEPLKLTYQKPNGHEEVCYQPQGYIMQTNKNHYISRWSVEHNSTCHVVHYNSLKLDRIERVVG